MLLRLNGIGADPEQIRHRFGGATIGIPEMLRCAKEFARPGTPEWVPVHSKRVGRKDMPCEYLQC
jgi:hypothetical protein